MRKPNEAPVKLSFVKNDISDDLDTVYDVFADGVCIGQAQCEADSPRKNWQVFRDGENDSHGYILKTRKDCGNALWEMYDFRRKLDAEGA